MRGTPQIAGGDSDTPWVSVVAPFSLPDILPLATLDRDLRFLSANESFAEVGGVSCDDHVGRRVDVIFPDIGRKVITALARLVEGAKRSVVAEVSVGPGGGQVWKLVFYPDPGGPRRVERIGVLAQDVTAGRRARERSQTRLAFQELLIRLAREFQAPAPETLDDAIRWGLRQLVEFLGVQRAVLCKTDMEGRLVVSHSYSVPTFTQIPDGLVVDEAFPWVAATLRRGEVVRICTPADIPADAARERAWSESNGVRAHLSIPLAVPGIPLCALAAASSYERPWPAEFIPRLRLAGTIFADALAHRRAEEELQRTRESLSHMARVTTMGHLATSIAHEINQPLCAMVGNAQAALRFLKGGKPDMAEVAEALAEIVRDGKRAGEVIARTHGMLKRRDVTFTPQDVNGLLEGVWPIVENYARIRRVPLRAERAPGLPAVAGHAVQLQQVMTNLLVNAVDAVSAGAAGGRRAGVVASTATDAASRYVTLRVVDDGVGLPPGDVERVFEPYFTSKSGGLGVGLNISRTIIEAHGGRLWAERNPTGGASFSFQLPVVRAAAR